MPSTYKEFKAQFLKGYSSGCRKYFEKNGFSIEAAYTNLINGELEKAAKMFSQEFEYNPRAKWGLVLVQMISSDSLTLEPTFFEIKSFLEVDLNILITYYKSDYIERILRYADILAYYNIETYKYIGRVFWANDMIMPAMYFLNKAKDRFYNDPELHYLLGYIYYHSQNLEECKKSLEACLSILPEYAPALHLISKLY